MKTANKLDLEIRPVDTLMFRDGRPFNQGDPGAAEAVSVFPPYPSTVSGMVRALLPKTQKNLSFSAPVLCQGKQPLFPAPRSLLKAKIANTSYYIPLVPGSEIECDLGRDRQLIRLPVSGAWLAQGMTEEQKNKAALKEIEDDWITCGGLEKVLRGGVPVETDFVARNDLWLTEPRVGVGIEIGTRRPADGALYAATHTRPAKDVTLRVDVEALDGADVALGLATLGRAGGEHRMAEFVVKNEKDALSFPKAPTLVSDGDCVRFTIYHASPCFLWPMPRANAKFGSVALARGPGDPSGAPLKSQGLAVATVVSACLGKALMIGGWSLGDTKKDKGPTPMRPAIPAGSVWFLTAPAGTEKDIAALHGGRIGEGLGRGFGRIFIGSWSELNGGQHS